MPQQRRSVRRRKKHPLLTFLLLLLFCALFFRWSNRSLQIETFDYTSPRLPALFDGCVLVQISDLHGALFGEDNEELLEQVRRQAPDYILLTGDLQDQYRQTPRSYSVSLGRALADIAPTFFVTGNHEWAFRDIRELKRELEEAGVTVLSNAYVPLERGGDTLVLSGIDDPNGFAGQKTPEELAEEVRAAFGDPFWVLLAHRNNYFAEHYSRLGADLVVSGHGHGGIVRLPFLGGLIGTNRRLFPQWTSGLYAQGDSVLFVSRGLGNNTVPFQGFRIFNRPELAVVTLKS